MKILGTYAESALRMAINRWQLTNGDQRMAIYGWRSSDGDRVTTTVTDDKADDPAETLRRGTISLLLERPFRTLPKDRSEPHREDPSDDLAVPLFGEAPRRPC